MCENSLIELKCNWEISAGNGLDSILITSLSEDLNLVEDKKYVYISLNIVFRS